MHVDMHEQDLVPFIPTPFLSILFISISGRKRTGFAHNKLKLQSGRPLSASPICDVACLWCHYSIGKSQVHMPSRITASRSDAWSVSSTMWIVDTAMKEGRMCSIRQALTIGYSQANLIDITLHIISLEISKSKKNPTLCRQIFCTKWPPTKCHIQWHVHVHAHAIHSHVWWHHTNSKMQKK